ncbi:hypothetical protein GCM10007890_63550 [Methylobacterium tardum]|uniref:Uncharacterized protein n=1 Tax=Methylobacterium tardum TaxID=374432 RepID=A0AA37WWP2_9HYPH|nr:hypothetical protein GCM10007890_63550 [Methylobacterium tardum]
MTDAPVHRHVQRLLLQGDETGFRDDAQQGQERGREKRELHRGGAAPVAGETPDAKPRMHPRKPRVRGSDRDDSSGAESRDSETPEDACHTRELCRSCAGAVSSQGTISGEFAGCPFRKRSRQPIIVRLSEGRVVKLRFSHKQQH